MRLNRYINEAKWMNRTMFGYAVDFNEIRKISEIIKSFLDINNVVYNQAMNPHITIAQVKGKYTKDELVREIHKLPSNFSMTPKQLKLLWGKNVKKWFIAIEYNKANEYNKAFEMIEDEFPEVVKFPGGMKPHVSLFSIEGEFDLYVWNEIEQRNYKLPTIKLGKVQLFNKNFEVEFEHKSG